MLLVIGLLGAGLWIHALEVRIKTLQYELDDSNRRVEDAAENYRTAAEENSARVQLELARIDLQVLNIGVTASGHLVQLGDTIGKLNHTAASGQLSVTQRNELGKQIQQLQNDATQLRSLRTQTALKIKAESPPARRASAWHPVGLFAITCLGALAIGIP